MRKLNQWRRAFWDSISSAQTWQWLWKLLPQPWREWARESAWQPAVSLLLSALLPVLGWLQGVPLFHIAVGVLLSFAALLFLLGRLAESFARFKAQRMPFKVRALPGDSSGIYLIPAGNPSPLEAQVVYARLEVEADRFLVDCSATVTSVLGLHIVSGQEDGKEVTKRYWWRLAGYPREIGWQTPDGTMRLRNLTPGVPRLLNVAVLDQNEVGKFGIAAIDGPRPEYPPGWYKVDMRIASESNDKAVQDVSLVVGLGTRDHPPPPLACYIWREDMKDSLRN